MVVSFISDGHHTETESEREREREKSEKSTTRNRVYIYLFICFVACDISNLISCDAILSSWCVCPSNTHTHTDDRFNRLTKFILIIIILPTFGLVVGEKLFFLSFYLSLCSMSPDTHNLRGLVLLATNSVRMKLSGNSVSLSLFSFLFGQFTLMFVATIT